MTLLYPRSVVQTHGTSVDVIGNAAVGSSPASLVSVEFDGTWLGALQLAAPLVDRLPRALPHDARLESVLERHRTALRVARSRQPSPLFPGGQYPVRTWYNIGRPRAPCSRILVADALRVEFGATIAHLARGETAAAVTTMGRHRITHRGIVRRTTDGVPCIGPDNGCSDIQSTVDSCETRTAEPSELGERHCRPFLAASVSSLAAAVLSQITIAASNTAGAASMMPTLHRYPSRPCALGDAHAGHAFAAPAAVNTASASAERHAPATTGTPAPTARATA